MIFLTAKWGNMKEKLHFVVGFVKNMTKDKYHGRLSMMWNSETTLSYIQGT